MTLVSQRSRSLAFLALLVPWIAWADIPATPVMTLYRFNGPLKIPYYDADRFAKQGPVHPIGSLTQGSSVIPCLVMRGGRPLTDARGTPYIGLQRILVDSARAGPESTERFQRAREQRRRLRVKNHHCPPGVKRVMNVRDFYALNKPPFFDPPRTGSQPPSKGKTELDRIVRDFHASPYCARANRSLVGRRAALKRAWDRYIADEKTRIPLKTLARAKHLDYSLRTALFEGHLDRGCNAYGACERMIIALSIRNRARGQCLKRQGCRFPGDFQGVSSDPSQYNIWDEFLTQISGVTACFLRPDLAQTRNRNGTDYARLQAMYAQNVGEIERILYGSDRDLLNLFPKNSLSDLTELRHYYHAPAMGKCFPDYPQVEYMSGAVAHRGKDYALIANTRIQVGKKVSGGYRFKEFRFTEEPDRDRVQIRDTYPGFIVDGRKVRLRSPRRCRPYGIPKGCAFRSIGRYRKTPSWLEVGKPLALRCTVQARGRSCAATPRSRDVWVGGLCDTQMRPVAHVR